MDDRTANSPDVDGGDSGAAMGCCSGARSCVRVVTCAILVCFAGLMLSIGIAWHVIKPDEPGFRVRSLTLSSFSVSDSELAGKYDVGLTIRNPNEKVQVWLDRFKLWVCYDEAQLAECSMKPSHLNLQKVSEKDVVGSGSGSVWGEVVGDLGKEWRKDVVKLNVKIQVRAKYEYGILPSRERVLDVYCGDLRVFFSAKSDSKHTGKRLSVGSDCHVNIID